MVHTGHGQPAGDGPECQRVIDHLGRQTMRTSRLAGAAAAAALLSMSLAAPALAADAAPKADGAGEGAVTSTVLGVDLGGGSLLSIRLLGEDGRSFTAGALVPPAVSAGIVPLTVASQVAPELASASVPGVT